MLVMGDALAMTLLESRGFTEEDFSRFHPGGSLGRALLTKVADIMRTGDELATAPLKATVHDALTAMSRARSGAVSSQLMMARWQEFSPTVTLLVAFKTTRISVLNW